MNPADGTTRSLLDRQEENRKWVVWDKVAAGRERIREVVKVSPAILRGVIRLSREALGAGPMFSIAWRQCMDRLLVRE